jgi:hypothetical protein
MADSMFKKIEAVALIIVIAVIPCTCTKGIGMDLLVKDEVTVKVKTKEAFSKTTMNQTVFTEKEVFIVDDSYVNGVWDTADLYNEIEPGKCYTFIVTGWRIPFLSAFRKAIAAKNVECK